MIHLIIPVIGKNPELEISQEYADRIRLNHNSLSAIHNLEMKFDLVVGNYFDLQKDFLDKALKHSLYNNPIIDFISRDERDFTRKLFNFLSTAKMYLDQVPSILKDVDKEIGDAFHIEIKKRREDTNNFTFRLLIALRNHMQHFDFSTGVYEGSDCINIDRDTRVHFHHSGITLNVKKFMNNESMKKQFPEGTFLKEEKIDLTEHVQIFFQELCLIHKSIRESISSIQSSNIEFIESVFVLYSKKTGYQFDKLQQFLAISEGEFNDDTGETPKLFTFTKNAIRLIDELQKQNPCRENMIYQVASNATLIQMKPIKDNCDLLIRIKK